MGQVGFQILDQSLELGLLFALDIDHGLRGAGNKVLVRELGNLPLKLFLGVGQLFLQAGALLLEIDKVRHRHEHAGIVRDRGNHLVGVGGNRVKDADFPDTVFGVVYDYEHTVQFEPVSKGTIHEDPKPADLIAAYLVLEGANTAGDCTYFVNPDFGSYWFDNNLDYVMSIGRHNFYVSKGNDNAGTGTGTDPS